MERQQEQPLQQIAINMKKILLLILIGLTLGLTGCVKLPNPPFGGEATNLADNLKLKATKDKILNNWEEDDIRCSKLDINDCVNLGTIEKYRYISNEEVPLANIKVGKKIIQEDLSMRTNKGQFFKINETEYVGNFTLGFIPHFYKDKDTWFYIRKATTTIEAWNLQNKTTLLDKLFGKKALAADYLVGSGDGYVNGPNNTADWATDHDATSGAAGNGNIRNVISGTGLTGGNYFINKGFAPASTVIGASAVITAASLNVWVDIVANGDNDGDDWITVVQTTQANPNGNLVNADYNKSGTTEGIDTGERKDLSSISTGAFLTFNLNATGIGWIDKVNPLTTNDNTKGTRLGLREGHDVLNHPYAGADGTYNYLYVDFSETDTPSQAPYLSITYTINTCTYSGSGDWAVQQSDGCYITSNVYVNGAFNLIGNTADTGLFGCAPGVKVSATVYNLGTGKTHLDFDCFSHHY